jgi:hypothetical protein
MLKSKSKPKSKIKAKESKDISAKAKGSAAKVAAKKKEHESAKTLKAAVGKKKPEVKKHSVSVAVAAKKAVPVKKDLKAVKPGKESEQKAAVKKPEDLKKLKKEEPKKVEAKKVLPVVDKAKPKGKELLKSKEVGEPQVKVKLTAEAKKAAKAEAAKAKKDKTPKADAPEEELLEDTEDFGADELSEYESELASAEEESEEEEALTEEVVVPVPVVAPAKEASEDIILTDAEGRRYCRVRDCDQIAVVDSYCRYHYLLLWKKIQVRKKILADGKLERYVEELTSRYPDKFLEVIRRDLRTEKDFLSAIQELEIDESNVDNDFEDESSNFIDEVRGASSESISDEEEF